MYKAILHGKYRGIDKGQGQQNESEENEVSFRSLYSGTEDFLTAGVFTRLSYLDSRYLWEILGKTFKGEAFKKHISNPGSNPGDLKNIQFWPSWTYKKGKRVEPDVFLEFENMNVIVEAKFGDAGNPQYKEQWQREWEGMRKKFNDSEQDREKAWLFAIGGVSDKDSFMEWGKEINAKNKYYFKFAYASWQDLYDILILKNKQCPNRIVEDIISILEFHGYHTQVWLAELPNKICKHNLHINDVSLNYFLLNKYPARCG